MKITIFGAGAFGSALGNILTSNGHQIEYYDPIKYPEKSLMSAVEGAELYILAVPSNAAPKVMFFMSNKIPSSAQPKDSYRLSHSRHGVKISPLSLVGLLRPT